MAETIISAVQRPAFPPGLEGWSTLLERDAILPGGYRKSGSLLSGWLLGSTSSNVLVTTYSELLSARNYVKLFIYVT